MDVMPLPPSPDRAGSYEARAREAAQRLEASFLAEMLKSAGLGKQENSLSGGHGEDQFASFYTNALAEQIAAHQGLGLAEQFFNAMMEARNDA